MIFFPEILEISLFLDKLNFFLKLSNNLIVDKL
jgi:hypothetical protein